MTAGLPVFVAVLLAHGPALTTTGEGARAIERDRNGSPLRDTSRAVVRGDVVAERVELRRGARVEADVEADEVRRHPQAAITGALAAYAATAPAVADVARPTPGRTDFTSRPRQTVILQPGRYAAVRLLPGARLERANPGRAPRARICPARASSERICPREVSTRTSSTT